MFRIKKIILTLSLAIIPGLALSQDIPSQHVMVAPKCLTKSLKGSFNILATTKDLDLISVNESDIQKLIHAKHHQKTVCGGFMDVTADFNPTFKDDPGYRKNFLKLYSKTPSEPTEDYSIRYKSQVKNLLSQINPNFIWNRLTRLTQYPDRYANSQNGLNAALEIKNEIIKMAETYGHSQDVSVYLVPTGNSYKQPSVVAKFGKSNLPGVLIGAHMDTLPSFSSLKPGADDDGSGTVVIIEIARTLLASGMNFKKPIYFAWYSAEELGLIGSQYVVKDFKEKNIPVSEVIQFDMTGYVKNNDLTMWLIDDRVNKNLTSFLESLVNEYIKVPVKHTRCGYACSDHASWNAKGYTAAMPFEAAFDAADPYVHTSQDTIEKLSLKHMTNFASLGIAAAIELAEPVA